MASSNNSRALPLRHLSVRVPWHDSQWKGAVCRRPSENASCLVLQRIRENRNDDAQNAVAGRDWRELEHEQLPPCVGERGGFMAPFAFTRTVTHPYTATKSPPHQQFAPTPLKYAPYSAACVPFRWMHRDTAAEVADTYEVGFDPGLEDRANELMGFNTQWLQDGRNQVAMLDAFFSAVKPERSLCFFYARQTPVSEDTRKVLIGVGRVRHVGPPTEYRYKVESPTLHAMLWERMVQHSIRADRTDGFLLPYHDLLDLVDEDPSLDLSRYVSFVPDDHWNEFSYTAEHVGHDGAIASLLNCEGALRAAASVLPGNWEIPLRWINDRLGEVWRMRGPCPGLGAALTAFGVPRGHFLAYDLASVVKENEDPWLAVEQAFDNPQLLQLGLEKYIGDTLRQKWKALKDERRALLKLLSRFDLSDDQASRFYQPTEREKRGITVSDSELLANPYLLYELDRISLDATNVSAIDRGVFPDIVVRDEHPLPEPSRLTDATDPRRVRALTVSVLEKAAEAGDTLWPRNRVIQAVRELSLEPECPIDEDLMGIVEPHFKPVLVQAEMAEGKPAYQLQRLSEMGGLIRKEVERRAGGKRHDIQADWAGLLGERLDKESESSRTGDQEADVEAEQRARQEKVSALAELAASRVSVLIGPAGTGKTTLLSVLCSHPEVSRGEVTLLAPTGKARVQLEQSTGIPTQTVAQFLVKADRYDTETGRYHLSDRPPQAGGKTVIIDEASMLTEEQLAAVFNALSGVQRLILVGDPRQLPPIGSGRPFVDIITKLTPPGVHTRFPRVGPGYAELTIRRRQVGRARDDLLLAEWFSGEDPGPGADEIWDRVQSGKGNDTLRFVHWDDGEALQTKLLEVLVEELHLDGLDDVAGFERSVGGRPWGDSEQIFFWPQQKGEPGAAARAESWQILSPVRGQPYGVVDVNRAVQRRFRWKTYEWAQKPWRKIPAPAGPEDILYGDKVINTRNKRRDHVYPADKSLKYVANGEIGVVVGQYKGKATKNKAPWKLQVELSSQLGYAYDYFFGEFSEEGEPPLELAYAITVHKSQGSEFGCTFLILPALPAWLSRELLYTALTRQRDRLVVLYQGELAKLKDYATPSHSETARRLTNLFERPRLVQVDDRFLEENLIHRTRRNEAVRSKSEVIIADLLYSLGLAYAYEQKLVGDDDVARYPDFTIDDPATGEVVYWEHLGMLHDPAYRRRWDEKLSWYRTQGIIPSKEGRGPRGTLLITHDDEHGGADSTAWEQQLKEILHL